MAEIDMKGKLVELLGANTCKCDYCEDCEYCKDEDACIAYLKNSMADYLIAHGVTVQEWIPASEPPTLKDADKYGRVLAMEMGMMALVNYKGLINYPDRFPYWMPLPQPPKGD